MHVKHQLAARRKWRNAFYQARQHLPNHLPPVIFLTDPVRTPDPLGPVRQLPAGSAVLYRHFGMDGRYIMAEALQKICQRHHLQLLISSDPDLARQIGADGVHWPEKQLGQARKWSGRFRIQTASAHSRTALHTARRAGMDAALMSTVFASQSPSAGTPTGRISFKKLCETAPVPVYGLGGVTALSAPLIAPFAGLAAIQALDEDFRP